MKGMETQVFFNTDGGGGSGGPLIGGAKPPEGGAPPADTTYTFAKVGEPGKEVDVHADDVKIVSEFAKTHKFTQEQAQAFMTHHLSNKPKQSEVPETYVFNKIKTKDAKGAETEADVPEAVSKTVAEFAKANGMTQAQAQAFMDYELNATTAAEKAYAEHVDTQTQQWRDEARKDPVLGKGNFEQNLGMAKHALDKFFPGLAENVNQHYFLDHPMILRGLYEIGKRMSEDSTFVPGGGSTPPPAAHDVMFPTMAKKQG